MSDVLDLIARDQITFSLYSPATDRLLFVSNDTKDGDNIVEAHSHIEYRNIFVLERDSSGLYVLLNRQYEKILFVSNDKIGGDRIVEAHGWIYRDEERNLFQFDLLPNGNYRIYNPATQCYLFVSNDSKGGDLVVEGHDYHYQTEYRNEFQLRVNYNYKRWMELNPKLLDKRLAQICLPASHDSGAYRLQWRIAETTTVYATIARFCDQVDSNLKLVSRLLPSFSPGQWVKEKILFPTAAGLASATGQSIANQLTSGIRCLDLRVCYDP